MTPDQTPNERVTLAVVQNEVMHVREDIKQLREDLFTRPGSHEDRLRSLERQSPWRTLAEAGTAVGTAIAIALGFRQP